MKKILLALILVVSTGVLYSQTKEQASALKALEKAEEESKNPKKSTNPATWIKLADAYMNIWGLPSKNVWQGASNVEAKMLLKGEQILTSEQKEMDGEIYTVDKYADKDLYYNQAGILSIISVHKRLIDGNILDKAYDALIKAHEADKSASKSKDIVTAMTFLKDYYLDEAMTAYYLNDVKRANEFFELSLKTSENPVINGIDSLSVYYTAVTAHILNDMDEALKYYNRCREIGYDDEGAVYGNIAEIYIMQEKIEEAKEVLSAGFSKYPTNQAILVNLINLYLKSNEDPKKVLDLIHSAQENEPGNASLYYAEGQVYSQLGDLDKAVELYYKSYEVNPDYEFGIFSIGAAYYDKALENQALASEEMDDTKYDALVTEMEEYLKKAIDPFEKAFSATKDVEIKSTIADYLKNIYFRFRDQDAKYQQGYDKCIKFLEENAI